MTSLAVTGIRKSFGRTSVLKDVSLNIRSGELFFILGASGCGKSTLLRILAGLETPDAGTVTMDGVDITSLPAHRRGIGMVFQQYALWPHMTVAQNVRFGLDIQKLPKQEKAERVMEALRLVRMEDLGSRYPHEISGGQQQRVALARALAIRPKVLLLDEPLSNLDARLREEIRSELRELHQQLQITMVYVTHDQEDALTLASRIALFQEGRIAQLGTPQELYQTPRTAYVAKFLGEANLLPCSIVSHSSSQSVTVRAPDANTTVVVQGSTTPQGASPFLCIRPESLSFTHLRTEGNDMTFAGVVRSVSYRGSWLDVECVLNSGTIMTTRAIPSQIEKTPHIGDNVTLRCSPQSAVLVA
jgi:spermidine/putrescine ABC transporter ATP-binding subunit